MKNFEKKTGKTLNFKQKKTEKPGVFNRIKMFSSKILI